MTIQKSKKIFYGDHFLIGQIIEASNPPENINSYVCKENEVKFFRPKYHVLNGEFLGLYETIGSTVVRGDKDEIFFNDRYDKEKSKIFYSHFRRMIPN